MLSARFARWGGLMALLAGVLWAVNARATAGLAGWIGHAGGHLAVGLPAGLLALGGARLRGVAAARGGRLGDVGALAVLAGGRCSPSRRCWRPPGGIPGSRACTTRRRPPRGRSCCCSSSASSCCAPPPGPGCCPAGGSRSPSSARSSCSPPPPAGCPGASLGTAREGKWGDDDHSCSHEGIPIRAVAVAERAAVKCLHQCLPPTRP